MVGHIHFVVDVLIVVMHILHLDLRDGVDALLMFKVVNWKISVLMVVKDH